MIIKSMKDAPLQQNPHKVEVRRLFDNDNAQAMHITLRARGTAKTTHHSC